MSNIDKCALREAAEKATPGRIGDRIDGSGSIKYQCFGNDGSLVLQTDHKNMEYGFIGENSEADELFFRLCDPTTLLAVLDELEAKDRSIDFLKDQLAQLANFNPDWDKLEAATDSLREHMAKLSSAEKRIAELSHHLKCAHGFIEHTEAFGHEAASGILCCGDAQWNVDASKSVLAAVGKGE